MGGAPFNRGCRKIWWVGERNGIKNERLARGGEGQIEIKRNHTSQMLVPKLIQRAMAVRTPVRSVAAAVLATALFAPLSTNAQCEFPPPGGIDGSYTYVGPFIISATTDHGVENACNNCNLQPSDERIYEVTFYCAGTYTFGKESREPAGLHSPVTFCFAHYTISSTQQLKLGGRVSWESPAAWPWLNETPSLPSIPQSPTLAPVDRNLRRSQLGHTPRSPDGSLRWFVNRVER